MLADSGSMPVMIQYGGDTTPLRVKHVETAVSCDLRGRVVGMKSIDLFVQHLYITCATESGGRKHTVLLREPLVMTAGKSMRALIAGAISCLSGMDMLGGFPDRICIYHSVLDRGMTASFRNALSGYWIECESEGVSGEGGQDLLRWHASLRCCPHDCHNSLKWAELSLGADEDCIKKLFVCVQVYKTCSLSVVGAFADWLGMVLQGCDQETLPPAEDLSHLYTSLGCDVELVEFLANRARVSWDEPEQKLKVDAAFLEDETCVGDLCVYMLRCYHFHSFTSSRWATIGRACRSLTLAMALGFRSLFDYMCRNKHVSEWDSARNLQLSHEHWAIVVSLALVSYVPDALLLTTLEDSRLAMRSAAIRELVSSEVEFIEEMPVTVWRRLASFTDVSYHKLRNSTLQATWVAVGYLQFRVLQVLETLPWSLCSDVDASIEYLANLPAPPGEAIADKIWALLRMGYSKPLLQQALQLLSGVSWSTQATEKLHASATLLARHHPDYRHDTLTARALLHAARFK
eukprot:5660116-Amphidinium_carterae.1